MFIAKTLILLYYTCRYNKRNFKGRGYLRKYIWYKKFWSIGDCVANSLSGIASIILTVYCAYLIDAFTAVDKADIDLTNQFLLLALIMVSFLAVTYLKLFFQVKHTKILKNVLTLDIGRKLINSTLEVSETQNIVTTEIDYVIDNYFLKFRLLAYTITVFLTTFFVGSSVSFEIVLITLIFSVFTFIINTKLNKKLAKKQADVQVSNKGIIAVITSVHKCVQTVNIFNAFKTANTILTESFEEKKAVNESYYKEETFVETINNIFTTILNFGALIGCILLLNKGEITIGEVTLLMYVINQFTKPLKALTTTINQMKSTESLRNKFEEILSIDSEVSKDIVVENITLNNVAFSYNQDPFITDLNLTFEKGKKYLIMGSSGSGKSTILKMLLKDNLHTKGDIFFGEYNLNDLNKSTIYKHISYAGQTVEIIIGTLRENIVLDKPYNEAIFNQIIKILNLEYLRDKFDVVVNETLDNFSGGELQRIAIARMLYDDSDIFIFDEFTSALDENNARNIEADLLSIKNKTLISVSHRLHTTLAHLYDEIIILDKGIIKAQGKFEDIKEVANV